MPRITLSGATRSARRPISAANGTNEGSSQDVIDQADYEYWKDRYGNTGHGAIPSPTSTTFEMDFLNSSDAVLSTKVYDLRDDPTTLAWSTDQVVGVAPPNTAKVRVRVAALNMVDNCCAAGQDVLFDNFSLMDNVFAVERLANGNLNTPGDSAGWTQVEGPMGMSAETGELVNADSIAYIGFANRLITNPTPPPAVVATGQQGVWMRGFVNTTQMEPDIVSDDGLVTQTVPGTPGADYTFSTWSAWESGFCGGLAGTSTQTFMKLEFLDAADGVIGTHMLDLAAAGQVNDDNSGANEKGGNVEADDWRQFFLSAMAPAGTVNVRVSAGATGMFDSSFGFQSAFFDEFALDEVLPGSAALAGTVPEPCSLILIGIAVALTGAVRRRHW